MAGGVKKRSKSQGSTEDMISNLPDPLLHHIFSFLTMEDVVKTSLLSKRWKYLWTSLSVLNYPYLDRNSDAAAIIGTTLLRNQRIKIQRLSINLDPHVRACHSHIDSWIDFAMRRNVEELHINLKYMVKKENRYMAPRFLLDCGTLTVLRLTHVDLPLPAHFYLYLLTKLDISQANLTHLDTSHCPLLESLIIRCCNRNISIYAPNRKLRYLKIVDSIEALINNCGLTLYAPHLSSIEFRSSLRQFYTFQDLSSLRTATILFMDDSNCDCTNTTVILKLLKDLRHVEVLKLGNYCIENVKSSSASASMLSTQDSLVGSGSSGANTVRRNSEDVGWQFGYLPNPNDQNTVKCKLCGHISKGGIFRLKKHIAGIKGDVRSCPKASAEDKKVCKMAVDEASRRRTIKQKHNTELREEVSLPNEEVEDLEVNPSLASKRPRIFGPMDRFEIDPEESIREREKGKENVKQTFIKDAFQKEARERVNQYVARWIYQAGIPFHAVIHDSFTSILEAIGAYGRGYKGVFIINRSYISLGIYVNNWSCICRQTMGSVETSPLSATYLELTTDLCRWELPGFASLLQSFPCLESLSIDLSWRYEGKTGFWCDNGDYDIDKPESWKHLELAFCACLNLRTVTIHNFLKRDRDWAFDDEDKDMKLVRLMLKQCKVLGKMTVVTSWDPKRAMESELLHTMKDKLLAFPRGSESAEVYISYRHRNTID